MSRRKGARLSDDAAFQLLLEMGVEPDPAGDLLRKGLRWEGGKRLNVWAAKRVIGQPLPEEERFARRIPRPDDDKWRLLEHSYVVNNLGTEVIVIKGASHAAIVDAGSGSRLGWHWQVHERQNDGTYLWVEYLFEFETDQVRKLAPKPKGTPGPKAQWRELIPPTIKHDKAKRFKTIEEYIVLLRELGRGKPYKIPEKNSDIREQLQKAGVRNSN
jgi:hypothetical protein